MSIDDFKDSAEELREQLTILKAERDEARADASGLYKKLFDLLSFIHSDLGVVNNIGLDAATTEAVALIVNREREATALAQMNRTAPESGLD